MLSIDQCRALLGHKGRGMSDEEIRRLRDQLYGLADVALTVYLETHPTRESRCSVQ